MRKLKTKKAKRKSYCWHTRSTGAEFKAKNMNDAVVKAVKNYFAEEKKLKDSDRVYFPSFFVVVKGTFKETDRG